MNFFSRNGSSRSSPSGFAPLALLAILTLQFALILRWSWRKWPDVIIDFGRELYVPWQISSGKVLYRDIGHLFGPLSQYFNALLFKLFGASFTTIFVANILILAGIVWLLYILLKESCTRFTGFLACSVVICIFSCSQYVLSGNYNFISPYSHEATHGLFLSLLMIFELWRFADRQRRRDLILAGFVFGLVFLTKIDILFSSVLVAALFFLLDRTQSRSTVRTLKTAGLFLLCSCIPILFFLSYFMAAMPTVEALKGVCGSWISLLNSDIAQNSFYEEGMGLDQFMPNVLTMFYFAGIAIVVLSMALFLSYSISRKGGSLISKGVCGALLCTIICLAFLANINEIGRPLPLLTLASFVFLLLSFLKLQKWNSERTPAQLPVLLLSIFSLGMLWKTILFCRLYHYGFYLALPSVVVLTSMLVWYLPEKLDRRHAGGSAFRMAMILMIAIFTIRFVQASNVFYELKTFPVGSGGDRILAIDPRYDARSAVTAAAVEWINANLGEKDTFVVVPEGVMINYLTRRTNPTKYTNFMMPEMLAYGETSILDAFKSKSPDYFILVHRDTSEYGVGSFGQDERYGKTTMDWIDSHYHAVGFWGRKSITGDGAWIKIMKMDGPA